MVKINEAAPATKKVVSETWNDRTALVQSSIRIFIQKQLRYHFIFDVRDEYEIADKMAAYFSVLMGE